MIEVKNGKVAMNGHPSEVLGDISMAIRALNDVLVNDIGFPKEDSKEFISKGVELAFATEEELRQEVKNTKKKAVDEILKEIEELKKMLSEAEEGEEEW